jgi:hypothetical protein
MITDLILIGDTPALFSRKKSIAAYRMKIGIVKAAAPINPPPIVFNRLPRTPVTSLGR